MPRRSGTLVLIVAGATIIDKDERATDVGTSRSRCSDE